MATVRRDVVYPRKVLPPGHTKPVDLAPWIPHLEKRQQEFIAAGLPIPYVWRHDDEAFPGSKSLKLTQEDGRLQLGEVKAGQIDADGILVDELEVPNEADHKQLAACRHVSPWIKWNWQDGTGKVWPGPSILHVATAPRPVQPTRALKLSHDGLPEELFLAMSDYERGDEMPEEEAKPKKESKKEIKAGDGFGPDILDIFKAYNLPLPPDTDEKNIWERIRIVGHCKAEADKASADQAPAGGKAVEVSEPANPVSLAYPAAQPSAKETKAEARLLKKEREGIVSEIALAFKEGRCDGDMKKEIEEDMKSLKLAFDDGGELVPNSVLATLKVWKRIPAGTYFDPAKKALRLAHERGQEVDDPEGEEKLDDHVMGKLTGGAYKAKA